jgi:metal-responsive CopG/Arc/MetJ family transcriptional regulator
MAKRPNKKIIAFRLPGDLMKTLGAKATKQHVSRNKLVEFILRSYLAKSEAELRHMIENPPEDMTDAGQIDLFA